MVNKQNETFVENDNIYRVPENINFPREEENIYEFWKKNDVFQNSLKQSKGKPKYSFYDGPPFATGLPHYGHILAGTIKDVVTRYAHQQGFHVDRRFGWDCHGLPVEYEIDKTFDIRGPEDVMNMGIDNYNGACRKIVMRYADEWEQIVGRMGRWIDFKNDYKTLYPWYMESIWWVFKQLFVKGLVYQGVKVMPYSTACTTALSNFESGQNYKEVIDPCVVVSFPVKNPKTPNENFLLLAWTTTPWTLPSNLSLCVNPEMIYVKLKELTTNNIYVLAESRLDYIFNYGKMKKNYEILEKFPGKKLEGLEYIPLFDYFLDYSKKMKGHRVLCDTYVTEESGTGIVHQAPYFGEDDYRVCLNNGIIAKDSEIICPVDDRGEFTNVVYHFKGEHVKDADRNIIQYLKSINRLVQSSQTKHSYPFCWRSDTPLIYKAVPSWFIRVEQMQQKLLAASSATYWVPDFVKEKRFGNWLREARDWAVSRNRYWGTPMPIWMNKDGSEILCIGSIEELQSYTKKKVIDLHRESIDDIEIPSKIPGNPPLRRITQVFDCWFESGSMPFAQQHYPFENSVEFEKYFPADFIAEGIDQTRGWFYTLLVISTALFDKAPFKNLIANGLVLASDGQKMSKRKKNYPDPMEVVNKYGADALRLYLINSPVVRAENLRFKEEGVRDIIKDVFLPWYNAYRFLFQNIERYVKEEHLPYIFNRSDYSTAVNRSQNIMDVWITSFKESLLEFVGNEMKAYRLYTVVPKLTKFIDQLTNWYVRLNRRRIKGESGREQCLHSLNTLYDVLDAMVKMMAPFTPFLSDFMYQRLSQLEDHTSGSQQQQQQQHTSVHYQMMPRYNPSFIKSNIEMAVSRMQSVIDLGRVMRDRRTMPTKYPVPEIIVIHKNQEYLNDIMSLKDFILGELNVRNLTVCSDKLKYGVTLRAEPDHKKLGFRLKGDFKAVMQAIKDLSDTEIEQHLQNGYFEILGNRIELDEVRIIYCLAANTNNESAGSGGVQDKYETHSDNDVLVLMDLTPGDDLLEEGIAREIINRIQKLKKKAQLVPTDNVLVYYTVIGMNSNSLEEHIVDKVAKSHKDFIQTTIKSKFLEHKVEDTFKEVVIISETFELKGIQLNITICLGKERMLPVTKWCNVYLYDFPVKFGLNAGMILIEDLTLDEFKHEIEILYGLHGKKFRLSYNAQELLDMKDINLTNITVIVGKTVAPIAMASADECPNVKYVNTEYGAKKRSIILENPKSCNLNEDGYLDDILSRIYPGVNQKDVKMNFS